MGQAWSPRARHRQEKQWPVNVAEQGRQDNVFIDRKISQQLLKQSIPVYSGCCSWVSGAKFILGRHGTAGGCCLWNKGSAQRQGIGHGTCVKGFERKKQKFSHRHLNKIYRSVFCSKILLGKMKGRVKPSVWQRRVDLTEPPSCRGNSWL